MKLTIKETLTVLDYDKNNPDAKQLIFASYDHITPGYAYDINITESNTGYSDLTFKMPKTIVDKDGNLLDNPKFYLIDGETKRNLIIPLAKIRYERFVIVDEDINIEEPINTHIRKDEFLPEDTKITSYQVGDELEHYIMDYIVQPVEKKRSNFEIEQSYTAIDYPRFTLSKRRVGMEISQDTITKPEWSLYENKPLSIEGQIQYIPYNSAEDIDGEPDEWNPTENKEFPLDRQAIDELIANLDKEEHGGRWQELWNDYGLAMIFYWKIAATDRVDGVLYQKGGYLTLNIYDYYTSDDTLLSLGQYTTERNRIVEYSIIGEERKKYKYAYQWSFLKKVDSYLAPNRPDNYMRWILDKTDWTLGECDIPMINVKYPSGTTEEEKILTANLSISGGNAYNAITTLCKEFKLYPVFDCINRVVNLYESPDTNWGLVYRLGENISDDAVKQDGEKVITKLYCKGGQDLNSTNITIGDADKVVPDGDAPEGEEDNWDPNDEIYKWYRTPYGTNYIYNFKYFYDNGLISKDEILDIYNRSKTLSEVNESFLPLYAKNRTAMLQDYYDAQNAYDLSEGQFSSIVEGMANRYYNVKDSKTDGYTYAFFRKAPQGSLSPIGVIDYTGGDPSIPAHYIETYCCRNKDCSAMNALRDNLKETDFQYPVFYRDGANLNLITPIYHDNVDEEIATGINIITYKNEERSLSDEHTCPWCGQSTLEKQYIKIDTVNDYQNTDVYKLRDNPYITGSYKRLISSIASYSDNDSYSEEALYNNVSLVKVIMPTEGEEAVLSSDNNRIKYTLGTDGDNELIIRSYAGSIFSWNENIYNYGRYFWQSKDAQRDMNAAWDRIEEIDNAYTNWENECATIENDIQNLYGQYIIEGNFNDDNQPYPNVLLGESWEESEKYGKPEITYTLNVIDTNGLVEYRDKNGYCNELVEALHNLGQVAPKPGQYVWVIDKPMDINTSALITQVRRALDRPVDNTITLDTSYKDSEDLVGSIITATNTVLNNQDVYTKTSSIRLDGTMDPATIKETLEQAKNNSTLTSSNGLYEFGNNGLVAYNADRKNGMRYNASGVYSTNDGGKTWTKLGGLDGLNASAMTDGALNTNNLVVNGANQQTSINNYGLLVKSNKGDIATLPTSIDGFNETNNISVFAGVLPTEGTKDEPQGVLYAGAGSMIAGWKTTENGFEKKENGETKAGIYATPKAIDDIPNVVFKVGENFYVDKDGNIVMSDGTHLVDNNGALTSLTFEPRVSVRETHVSNFVDYIREPSFGFWRYYCGYDHSLYDRSSMKYIVGYRDLRFDVFIPKDFVISGAYIYATHTPIWYSTMPVSDIDWCSCMELVVKKINQVDTYDLAGDDIHEGLVVSKNNIVDINTEWNVEGIGKRYPWTPEPMPTDVKPDPSRDYYLEPGLLKNEHAITDNIAHAFGDAEDYQNRLLSFHIATNREPDSWYIEASTAEEVYNVIYKHTGRLSAKMIILGHIKKSS